MKPEQRERLVLLLPMMKQAARRLHPPNAMHKALHLHDQLRDFLNCNPSDKTPEQWLLIAEEATKEN